MAFRVTDDGRRRVTSQTPSLGSHQVGTVCKISDRICYV